MLSCKAESGKLFHRIVVKTGHHKTVMIVLGQNSLHRIGKMSTVTDSYTHLDVYKRQK